MEIRGLGQADAHRRKFLIAGAAGLSEAALVSTDENYLNSPDDSGSAQVAESGDVQLTGQNTVNVQAG